MCLQGRLVIIATEQLTLHKHDTLPRELFEKMYQGRYTLNAGIAEGTYMNLPQNQFQLFNMP